MGSYENWARIIGGILDAAGIESFLANAAEFYEQSDVESAVWRAFVESWWDKHQDTEVGASDLFAVALETEGLDLGTGNERAQKTSFGKALGRQRDRVIGDYRIVQTGTVRRAARWRLQEVNVGERLLMPPRAPESDDTVIYMGPDAETFTNVHLGSCAYCTRPTTSADGYCSAACRDEDTPL